MKNFLKKNIRYVFPTTDQIIESVLRKEIKKGDKVLDLGCGPQSPLKMLKENPDLELYSVGVDIFRPYIERNINIEKIHTEIIEENILNINFPDNSFDCAIMIDVIEHIEKENFHNFLPKLGKIAKKIIIITPNNFVEQDTYDENVYQKHVSGWTVKEFKDSGFRCFGLSGLKSLRKELWVPKIKPAILGNFIADMTQPIVYRNPKLAYHIIAIKK